MCLWFSGEIFLFLMRWHNFLLCNEYGDIFCSAMFRWAVQYFSFSFSFARFELEMLQQNAQTHSGAKYLLFRILTGAVISASSTRERKYSVSKITHELESSANVTGEWKSLWDPTGNCQAWGTHYGNLLENHNVETETTVWNQRQADILLLI